MKGASCFELRVLQLLSAMVLVSAHAPERLSAQSDPRLVAAVRLAQDGQGDSARAVVKRIMDATPAADPVYAEALYTSGVVAGTAVEMERRFQRLVVEYNGSAWADDALLKLAQLNFARGDLTGVARNVERLASDYPQSEVIPEAAEWAARAYFREDSIAAGCRWLANGLARADTLDVELRNGLTFLNGRCVTPSDTTRHAAPDTTRPHPVTLPTTLVPATQDTAAPTRHPRSDVNLTHEFDGGWTVQVASSNSQANADALIARLARDGFAGGFVVKEGTTLKVRVGQFPARPAADSLLARMRAKYPGAFVSGPRP